jgi:signal transduction histidine kinase/DNA-binding NarL/FixJ family response regulator
MGCPVQSGQSGAASPAARLFGLLREWWLDRSVRVKDLILFAVPVIALVGTVSANLVLQHSEQQQRSVAIAAKAVSADAGQVVADAVNAETGVRGYAATGGSLFLAPYKVAVTQAGADLRALRAAAITEGDSGAERAIEATTATVFAELAGMRSAVSGGTFASGLGPAMTAEKTAMDLLRRQVAGIAAGPAALAAAQSSKITKLVAAIERLDVAGLILGLLAALAGITLFASSITRRITMNAENARLLGEGKPLRPVAPSGDEIGRVDESLFRAEKLLASRAAELTAARDEALVATRVKNTFLSRTSHELRTPLNSVLGFAQLLEMSDLSDEDRDSTSQILSAGRHLLALINELIDVARIESGELSLSVEPVLISPLLDEVSRLMRPLAAERSITITRDGGYPALAVRADRQRLSQVLVNLTSNAVKYNHRGGAITLTCQQAGTDRASVVVTDTGPGLPEEALERIFIPFERFGAEQTGIEGTGIGLPLARALTEAMGGQLTVASVLGQGSAFTVTVPRAPDLIHLPPQATTAVRALPATPGLTATAPAPATAAAPAPARILYIEDNPANIEVVSRFLQTRPHIALRCLTSGRDGLDYAAEHIPDIILLDIHMPDIAGDQVLSELKAEPATAAIPVVILSADATPGAIRRLLDNGAAAYLTKPLNLPELGALIDTLTRTLTLTGPADQQAQAAADGIPSRTAPRDPGLAIPHSPGRRTP